jgi:predicted Na+-dependent transporter
MHLLRHVERWFWAVCLVAVLVGLLPVPGMALLGAKPCLYTFLGGILFFTGLKIDFAAAWRELRRPWLLIYLAAMLMVVLPLGIWGLARLVVPAFAAGVLIVGAMPAGMACSSLTQISRGNAALALMVTLVTSLACPVVAPLVVGLGLESSLEATLGFLARQAGFLALLLFVPTAAAYAVRRYFPGWVARHSGGFTGLSILSLCTLIVGIVAATSGDFWAMVRPSHGQAEAAAQGLAASGKQLAGLFGFMCFFSVSMHLAGYFLAPWRPAGDRAAISIDTAYVNNGLAMVFANEFFRAQYGVAAVLPAVFLEIPMILAVLPLKAWLERRSGVEGAVPPPVQSE